MNYPGGLVVHSQGLCGGISFRERHLRHSLVNWINYNEGGINVQRGDTVHQWCSVVESNLWVREYFIDSPQYSRSSFHFVFVCIFLPPSFPAIPLTPSLSSLIRFIIKLQISLNPAISSESSPLFAVSRPLAYICPSALCFCASNYNTRSLPEETKQSWSLIEFPM